MKHTLLKWTHIWEYFFTPEDSKDTAYHDPVTRYPQDLPLHAQLIKTIFWIVVALILALLLAKLR